MINFKKIKSIIWENILYSTRENLLVWPIFLFALITFLYANITNIPVVSFLEKSAYIWLTAWLQYVLLLLIVVYLTITSFDKDIKSKNIYVVLQHTSRTEFFLGKVISNFLLLFLLNIIQCLIMVIWYLYMFKEFSFDIITIFAFQSLEILVLVLLLSLITIAFQKNIVRILLFWILFIFWHLLHWIHDMIQNWILNFPLLINTMFETLYFIVPNLEAFNVKELVLVQNNLWKDFIYSWLYALWLSVIIYLASIKLLNKKDF